MAITVQMRETVSQLYVSLFGRAPDGEGLGFWVSKLDEGKTMAQVADMMYATSPARAYYPSFLTNAEIIKSFYTNVFGVTNDTEGEAHWTAKLNGGESKGSVISQIIAAALANQNPSGATAKATLVNKIAVAQWYGEQNGSIEGAATILSAVTADVASVAAAKATAVQSGQTFTLTTGVDSGAAFTGGSGNDTFNATEKTLTALDVLAGGAGVDTLNLLDTTGKTLVPGGVSLSGIETINVRSAGEVGDSAGTKVFDVSTLSDVATLNVTQATKVGVKAATTTDVSVSGATDAIVVDGGKNITVTDATKDTDITIGASTVGAGYVKVNATSAGASNIAVDGGTTVTINVSGLNTTITAGATDDDITVGNGGAATDLPSSAVTITSAHTGVAATDVNLNDIIVKGGTTVSITQTADSSKAADDKTGATLTQGDVFVTAGSATTSVTVVQAAAVAEVVAVDAVAAKAATQVVTFGALKSGDVLTITTDTNQSISFKAAKDLTAAEVASAFANLAKNAVQGTASTKLGSYTNGSAGGFSNDWTSGAVTEVSATAATVTFSTSLDTNGATAGLGFSAANDLTVSLTNTSGASTASTAAAIVDGNPAVAAKTGVLGVVGGAVAVAGVASGTDAVTTVTLDGFGASSTVDSDALTTLNLANSNEGVTVTTASTGSITANLTAVGTKADGAALSLDGGGTTVTGLTLNATTASVVDVTADGVTALTINATGSLNLTGSSFNAAKTITVTGAGAVTLDEDGGYAAVTAIDASASTGGVDATAQTLGNAATFTGGAGKDAVKLGATTKAQTLGAGDDTVTLTAALGAGGSVAGGDGTDTVKTTTTVADGYDTSAQTVITGFERLTLTNAYGGATADDSVADTLTLDLANLGFANYVTTSGTGNGADATQDVLALDKMSNGGTVVLTANGLVTVSVKDAATGTADVLNVVVNNADNGTADSKATGLTAGTLTAANVETVNLTSSTSDSDGSSAHSLTLAADKATKLVVTGAVSLNLGTLSSSTKVTTIDASAMTGGLTVTSGNSTAAATITGGSGNDVFVGAADQDVLVGGAGNDKLTAVGELTTLTGGAGNDTFVMNTADTVNGYATITDLSAGDVIDTDAATFTSTKVTLAATAVFQDYANAAVNAVAADGAIWFQYGGDTYLVVDSVAANSTSFTNGSDQIIKITGTVDLSTAVFNATTGDLTII